MDQLTARRTASVGDALNNARHLLRSHPDAAVRQARAIITAEPAIAETYLILAAALRQLRQDSAAAAAEQQALEIASSDPVLLRAQTLLGQGRGAEAEALLRNFLKDTPNDPEALRLLAKLASSAGHLDRADQLLWRALSLAPGFSLAKDDYLKLLEAQGRAYSEAADKPQTPPEGGAEFEQAIKLNETVVERNPGNPGAWLSYGHVLRIAGRPADSATAYRKAVALNPAYGEAWWSLADLKTASIEPADVEAMESQLAGNKLVEEDRIGIHFALGTALGDAGRFEQSFEQFATGNRLKRKSVRFDAAAIGAHVDQVEQIFTRHFFATHDARGHPSPAPIFIVGMPRSGSTLVEQILASHPSIEGTEELVYFGNLASFLSGGRRAGLEHSPFVDVVAGLTSERVQAIGGAYLWNAARHRHSSRPHYIDKMPRNWLYLPLIKLALPNAKIIDVRRNPMDCCWSNFRQLFADSGEYSYDLSELGEYYRAYVRTLSHFDAVLPHNVHRVIYEKLVADPGREVRVLLDYLGLPFDGACLRFHENPRAVKTSSSEQVRRPITKSGIDQWRPYERWLSPLKESLGTALQCYPEAPSGWDMRE